MSNQANTLRDQGRLDEAAEMQKEVLEKWKRILGDEHPDTITAMSNLAITLQDQGRILEAAEMQKEVLEKRKRILGDEHPDTITAMNNLAITLRDQGRILEVAEIQKEVLEKWKRILGDEHPDTITAMNNLAMTLRDQGRIDEAASMLKEVLEKRKRILGDEHLDTITAMNNLAITLQDQGRIDEAASMQKEVLEKWKRILGDEHPATITAMKNLAMTLQGQGRIDEAASMLKEVLEKSKRILGDEHLDTITAMNNLAITLRDQGRIDEAASMLKEVLEKSKRILGDEHLDTITAMSNLAITLQDQGRILEAAEMQKEVLEKRKRILGDEHPDTITAMNNLAITLRDQGRILEVAEIQKEVLEKWKRILGDEHPATITAMKNLAMTLQGQGRIDEAASMLKEVLEKSKRILGDEHLDTITAMNNLAITLRDQGRIDEAASMQKEVLEKRKRILGDEHPDTITAMKNLAMTLQGQGRIDEAASMQKEVLEKWKRILGDEHPTTITAMKNLAITLAEVNTQGEYYGNALQAPSAGGHDKIVQQVLDKGAEVDAQGVDYGSALQIAPEAEPLVLNNKSVEHQPTSTLMDVIRQKILEDLDSTDVEHFSATFTVEWDLVGYVLKELNSNPILSNVFTVSGGAENAYACMCSEYVRWVWPEHGGTLLERLQASINPIGPVKSLGTSTASGTGHEKGSGPLSIGIFVNLPDASYPDNLCVSVTASKREIIAVAQQLAWLASTFRTSDCNTIAFSGMDIVSLGSQKYLLAAKPLESISQENQLCWGPLLGKSVIAKHFPIPEREGQVGLELPFEAMVILAGATTSVEVAEKVALCGISTFLFPSRVGPDSSSPAFVQWHFVKSPTARSFAHNVETLQDHFGSWVSTPNGFQVHQARTFVGYCRAVETHLGTESCDYSQLRLSGLSKDQSNWGIRVSSISIGSSGMGAFGAQFSGSIVFPQSTTARSNSDGYDEILDMTERTSILLYDVGSRQGWLVPAQRVLLHLSQLWIHRNSPEASLEYAGPSWTGSELLKGVLSKNNKLWLRKSLDNDQDYLLRDLVKRMWGDILACHLARATLTKETLGIVKVGNRIRGWELADFVARPLYNDFWLKGESFDVSSGWDALGDNDDVFVLVCKGIGNVITPGHETKLCRRWNPISPNRRYLTACVDSIKHFADRNGADPKCLKISNQVFWRPSNRKIFDDCEHGPDGPCEKTTQHLSKSEHSVDVAMALPNNGAVVFGRMDGKLHKREHQIPVHSVVQSRSTGSWLGRRLFG